MSATRRISKAEGQRALFADFEGQTDSNPVLLGVLFNPDPARQTSWVLSQYVMDPEMQAVDEACGASSIALALSDTVASLIDRSDKERRPVISWSEHDRNIMKQVTDDQAFRYRNAIQTAKRWRRRQRGAGTINDDPSEPNSLHHFESLIGYNRPPEPYDVGDSIAYIRGLKSVTPGAIRRWETILTHNRHDLLAMRDVTFTVLGLDIPS